MPQTPCPRAGIPAFNGGRAVLAGPRDKPLQSRQSSLRRRWRHSLYGASGFNGSEIIPGYLFLIMSAIDGTILAIIYMKKVRTSPSINPDRPIPELTPEMLEAGGTLLASFRADLWEDAMDPAEAAKQVFLAMQRARSTPASK